MQAVGDHIFDLANVKVARFVVNMVRENTYIIYNNVREGILIDCGARREEERQRLEHFVASQHISLHYHLLTHAHFDHIWGAQWVMDKYGLTPLITADELDNYRQAESIMQQVLHKDIALPLPLSPTIVDEGHSVEMSDFTLRYISTPGHTKGSACIYDKDNALLFCGDTMFKDYTTLPKQQGMTQEIIEQSIRNKILTLPKGTLVLPGHGPYFYL